MPITDELERAYAEQLMAAFAVVLTDPAGFSIHLGSERMWIDRTREGGFRVARLTGPGGRERQNEELFDDVRSAVGYFLDLRDELQIGADYDNGTAT